MKRREFILASGQLAMLAGVSTAADSRSLPQQARDALAKATRYVRSISTEGGYLWRYSLDLKERAGETKATATQVWIQPPGTPSMGVAFLRAYSATKDPLFLDAARAAGDALATGQLESGGWDYLIDFDSAKATGWLRRSDIGKVPATDAAKRKNTTTIDDDTSQSAVRFLLALADVTKGSTDPRDGRVRTALDYALKKMLETQYPNGAWPQRYDGKPRNAADYPVLKASRAKSLESRVQAAIAALDEQGRWVTKGDLKKRDFDFSDRVETSV
ncbi:MAG: pectate lyase, partial [Limisphaerales bacterium]